MRILVIRFSSIGDIILTTPVLRALRSEYPKAEIHYLVHEQFRAVVKYFDPPVDTIIPFSVSITTAQLGGYAKILRNNDYDLVIDLHNSLRSKYIRKYFRHCEIRVYKKPRLNRALLFSFGINRFPDNFSVIRQYILYSKLSSSNDNNRPQMNMPKTAIHQAKEKYDLRDDYLAIIPSAAWPQKSWLVDRYRKFIEHRLDIGNKIVVLGGPGDNICDALVDGLSCESLTNLKGRTHLDDALAVVAGCRVAVGADTGLLHAAEAFNKPVLMILGPTSHETGAKTHHPDSIEIANELECRPCSQNGKKPCRRSEQYCMTLTTTKRVDENLDQLLGKA